MLHIMLDMYGSESEKANDLKAIYEIIYKVINQLSLKAIMPPVLVPYYYGKVKEDDGISAFVLLKGGHFTIHTFPERECYFVDLLYDGFFGEDKLIECLARELPFTDKKIHVVDRRFDIEEQCKFSSIDESLDFGPHYLIRTTDKCSLSMEQIYHFLDSLPTEINMDPIMRPVVITDKVKDYSIVSGLTVIAQSHVALHYYMESGLAYIDIFSCSFINCENLISVVKEKLGIECESVLISRGSKHSHRLAQRSDVIERYDRWKRNIYK